MNCKYYVVRNNCKYGPYDINSLKNMTENCQIILSDVTVNNVTGEQSQVKNILKKEGIKVKIHQSSFSEFVSKFKNIIFFDKTFIENVKKEPLLILFIFAIAGPTLLISILSRFSFISEYFYFYGISLYFASIWATLLFNFFKTEQLSIKHMIWVFGGTQILVLVLFETGIIFINPFYDLITTDKNGNIVGSPLSAFLHFVFAVGISEEFIKLIPIISVMLMSKFPYQPKTVIYYGLLSGLGFAVLEGPLYQMNINNNFNYTEAYISNILRISGMPLIHGVWCSIGAFYLIIAQFRPKYKIWLGTAALVVPTTLHGIHDFCCYLSQKNILADLPELLDVIIIITSIYLLIVYLKKSQDISLIFSN